MGNLHFKGTTNLTTVASAGKSHYKIQFSKDLSDLSGNFVGCSCDVIDDPYFKNTQGVWGNDRPNWSRLWENRLKWGGCMTTKEGKGAH